MKYGQPTAEAISRQLGTGAAIVDICIQFGITRKQFDKICEAIPAEFDPNPLGTELTLSGNWIVCMDTHIPYIDLRLNDLMGAVAEKEKIDNLVVVGDIMNMDALSTFKNIVPAVTFKQELLAGRIVVKQWLEKFQRVVLIPGNHDYRWWIHHEGQMDGEELFSLLDSTGRIEWTKFAYCQINSSGVKYRASHPQEYSKLPLKNADELAQKYQCNIITAHEHHLGKTWDRYGRYVVVNGGCMEDASKAAYIRLRDNNKPVFHPGFVLLRDGVAEELGHYPYTNWDRWLSR